MAVSPDGILYVFQNTGLLSAVTTPSGVQYVNQNTGVYPDTVQPDGLLYQYQNTTALVGDGLPVLTVLDSAYRARMGTPREN